MSWQAPSITKGTSIRALALPEHWERAVQEILSREGIPAEGLEAFASGSDVVWGVPSAVVKLSTPRWAEQMVWEVLILRHVAGKLPLDSPKVLATGKIDGWPYFVMSRTAGQAIGEVWKECNHEERLELAGQVGTACRALHDIDLPESLLSGQAPWEQFWTECQGRKEQQVVRSELAHLAAECKDFLKRVGPLPQSPLALLHTELLGEHILVAASQGPPKVSGLIDFADARVGAPEYDVAAPVEFLFGGESGMLDAFYDGYGWTERQGSPPSPNQRLAWGLQHQFASLNRAVFALSAPVPQNLEELAQRLYS